MLVDRAGKPVSSCSYGRIAQGTDGFSVVNEGGSKVIVSTDGPRFLPGDFQILEVHGNGLIEARITTTGGEQVAFYNRAGQRVRHFDTGGGHHRLEVDSWVGAPVVTRCASEGCKASVLGPDGRTTAQFARLNVLEGQDVAAASTDGRHFGLIDTQLSWQGRRDYDEILAPEPLLARRDGGLTALDAQGRELIPLRDYQGIGRGDSGTIMAQLAGQGTCLYFSPPGDLEPARSAACLLRGDAEVGYYIFGNDTTSYVGADDGTPMSRWIAGLLLPLNRRAIAHVAMSVPGARNVGTVTPDGAPKLPHQYRHLLAFRTESGQLLRDDLLVAEVEDGTGLITLDGEWRIKPRYLQVLPISRGLVAAWQAGAEWQLFDTDGTPTGATHFLRPQRAALLDGTQGIVASQDGRMGVLGEDGRWRVPAQYEHVTITRLGGVVVYQEARPGHMSGHVLNLETNEAYPDVAVDNVYERGDGLLEGHSAADATRYLFTVKGEILATVHVPITPFIVPRSSGLGPRPAWGTGPADCAFHGYVPGNEPNEPGTGMGEAAVGVDSSH